MSIRILKDFNLFKGEAGSKIAGWVPVSSNLKRRYTQLVDQLSRTGAVLPGTITERRIIGQASQKQVDRKKYGPYYQWTRKVNGKTVTVNLSEAQVDLFQKAIDNNRKIEQTLSEMKQISIQRLENETQKVKRRRL